MLMSSSISTEEINSSIVLKDLPASLRTPKIILPFIIPPYPFGLDRFPRAPCTGTDNKEGICLSQTQCNARNGASAGSCANNRGVCCVFLRTCGGEVSSQTSYFTNVGYPNSFNGGTRCTFSITKQAPFICQMRLDFIDLHLAPPRYDGVCTDDMFSFGDASLPRLCGENTGLHGYVDFATNCDTHTLTIDTSSVTSYNRKWNIKVTQIGCNSTTRAPRGCLMYFDATSGTVSSYNFITAAPPPNPNLGEDNLNMMANLNYGVCVRPALGYCSIVWSQSSNNVYTFTISGNTDEDPSTPGSAKNGMICTHNFVVIPNPIIAATPDSMLQMYSDRFCGNALLPTRSFSRPFVLTVVTSPRGKTLQEADINNRGFLLDFRQMPCSR